MSITTRTVYVGRCDECGALMSDEGYECQWPTEEDARDESEEWGQERAWGRDESLYLCAACAPLKGWYCRDCFTWFPNRIQAAPRDDGLVCPECMEAEG